MKHAVVVPWVKDEELTSFLKAWHLKLTALPEWLILQRDSQCEGCGVTKNKGVVRAVERGADVVVILDGDCYPSVEANSLEGLLDAHVRALEPQPVALFRTVTDPPSRGTPYGDMMLKMPVAASMGFWNQVPDYCAVRQLAFATKPMVFQREAIYGSYFALCGMNLAFRPSDWLPWCQFIDVPRFDDIWMGWLWQKEAYQRGYCFNLNGPLVTHARQSNVWKNLQQEAMNLEANEQLWKAIATDHHACYADLRKLLLC